MKAWGLLTAPNTAGKFFFGEIASEKVRIDRKTMPRYRVVR